MTTPAPAFDYGPIPRPLREADIALGTLLLVCAVLGVPANCLAFYHFVTQTAKNNNSIFFKRTYTIISGVDLLIGLWQLPIPHTLLIGRNSEDVVFERSFFCHSWYIIWITLKQGVIFMVAFLSIARLIILMYSKKMLSLRAGWLVPTSFAGFVFLVLGVAPLATRYVTVFYEPNNAMCIIGATYLEEPSVSSPAALYSTPSTAPFVTKDYSPYLIKSAITYITESFFFALPVLPVLISFAISMKFLRHADQRSKRMTMKAPTSGAKRKNSSAPSGSRHKDASVTILTVTLAYVIFNIPSLGSAVYLAYIYSSVLSIMVNKSLAEAIDYSSTIYVAFGPAWCYTWLLVYGILPVLNSTVNPAIYLWRMKHFRDFVTLKKESLSGSYRRVRTMSSRLSDTSFERSSLRSNTCNGKKV